MSRPRRRTVPDAGRPSAGPDLLLHATFLSDHRGLDAWRRWRATTDLDEHLDLGSYRLLPLLTRRLRERGVEDPLLDKFAGISRKHWLANRLLLHDVEQIATALRSRDIRTMVPSQIALVLAHYGDHPLDAVANSAVVVPAPEALAAFAALDAAGWTPVPRIATSLLSQYVAARCWHPFQTSAGRRLRLHWHVLAPLARPTVDDELWSRAEEVSLGPTRVAALDPADQIVDLCTERVAMYPRPVFVRAVDVMLLLTACRDRIDWDRVIEQAAAPGLTLPVQATLRYLQDRLDEPVPADAFRRILAHRTSSTERLEYELSDKRASWAGDVLHFWLNYRRASTATGVAAAARFPRFLQHYLRLPSLWHVPARVVASVTDRVRQRAGTPTTRTRAVTNTPDR